MIDGTAYSIMTTREVNDTVVVEMNPTSISKEVMTLENAAFDWTKYDLAEYFVFGVQNSRFIAVKTSIENSMGSSYMGWPISDKSKLVCTVILKRKG